MFKKISNRGIAKIGIVAALYVVMTVVNLSFSYGAVQFRFSEVLNLLAFVDPLYIPALTIGCAIANVFSPLGIVDVIVGSIATLISTLLISKTKNLLLGSLWPSIINGIFVGAELYYISKLPFLATSLYVAAGEFVVVTIVGYPLFKLLMKNEYVLKVLKLND